MEDKNVGVTVSQLREFVRATMQDYGVRALDRDESAAWTKEFSAASFAFHFRFNGRQACQALDALAAADLVSWIETRRGYDDRWALTRNGLYVTEALVKCHNRVQAKAARAIQARMTSLQGLESDFGEVRRIIGWGPWMSGLEYGPVLIGLEVDSWSRLEPERRLRLIAAAAKKLALHEALPGRQVPSVAVLGFNAERGVPWRLRTHQLLGGSGVAAAQLGGVVKLKRSQLDVDESAYEHDVQDLAIRIGLWTGKDDQHRASVSNLYWWEVGSERFAQAERDLAPGADRAAMFMGRLQVAAELAAVRLAPCEARKAKGRPKLSEQLQQVEQEEDDSKPSWGVPAWARVEGIGLGGVRVDALGAHAEAMHERGVLDQAAVDHARSLGSKARAEDIRKVYRQALQLWLKDLREEQKRHSKVVKKPQQKAKVQYLTVFTVGLGVPSVIAIVRQPLTQRKAFWSALDSVKSTVLRRSVAKYGEPMLSFLRPEGDSIDHDVFDGMGLLTCAYRPSKPEEREVFDAAAKEVGRVVRSIHFDREGHCIATMKGFLDTEEIKGTHGLDRLRAEPDLPLMIDDYAEAKQLLDQVRDKVGPAFFADFEERWLDPATTDLHKALRMMSGAAGELMGRRLCAAVWSDVWFDNHVWPPASRVPVVTMTAQGDVKIVASFPNGSVTWQVGANLKVVKSQNRSYPGRQGWYLVESNTWEAGVLELVRGQEVVCVPLFVQINQKEMSPSLGDALTLLRSMRWFCEEDPVGFAKALVPGHWRRDETFDRLWEEAAFAWDRERDARGAADGQEESEDRYAGSRKEIASHLKLTDVQWLAALIDLALVDNESSATWSRNVFSAALGQGTESES